MASETGITGWLEMLRQADNYPPTSASYVGIRAIRGLLGLPDALGRSASYRNELVEIERKELDDAEVIEALLEALRSKHGGVRVMAALALGGVRDSARVIEALRKSLDDGSGEFFENLHVYIPALGSPRTQYGVSEMAAYSLVRLGDRESAGRMVQHAVEKWWHYCQDLKTMGAGLFRWMIALGWESVITDLAQQRDNPDPGSLPRLHAVALLAGIGGAQVVQPLLGFLNDKWEKVRVTAVQALGEIGDPRALAALIEATQDKNWGVRRAAQKAIKQIEAKNH